MVKGKSSPRFQLLLIIFSICAALIMGFLAFTKPQMEHLYRSTTFYFLLAAAILWLQKLSETAISFRQPIIAWLKANYGALLLALLLIIAAAAAVPGEYRILADETNLLGMAQAMYEEHKTYNPTQAMFYNHGMMRVVESVVDMRPAFYPFHIYLAHSLLGYDPANAFIVNLIAAFFILLLLYFLVERYLNRRWAILAMPLLAAFPLFVIYARSAGFETVNLLWAMLLFAALYLFLRRSTASHAELLLLTLPLLAQTRYESALTVLVIIPIILLRLEPDEYAKLSFRTILLPFLFLPVAWLRIVTFSSKAFQVGSVEQAFGFDLLLTNLRNALPFFFGKSVGYGMLPFLAFCACAGLVKFMIDLFSKSLRPQKTTLLMLGALTGFTVLHALARFFYFWGNMTLQYTSRLGIIFLPVIVLLAIYFLKNLQQLLSIKTSWFGVLAIALLVHGWPVAAKNMAVREIHFYREFKTVRQFLQTHYPDKQNILLVSDLANLYVPMGYSALYTGYARENARMVLHQLAARVYKEIVVIQKIDSQTHKPVKASQLSDKFDLTVLYEKRLNMQTYIRVSCMTQAQLPKEDNE